MSKKLVTGILALILLGVIALGSMSVFADEYREFPCNLGITKMNELIELIETEDENTFLSALYELREKPYTREWRPAHVKTIPFYRERGYVVECSVSEKSEYRRGTITLGSDSMDGVICYSFIQKEYDPIFHREFGVSIIPIDKTYSSVLETEGVRGYIEAKEQRPEGYFQYEYEKENTVTLGSGEKITYYVYNPNKIDYVYFVYGEELVKISGSGLKLYELENLLQYLCLKKHVIEKKPLIPGYGHLLILRSTFNNSGVLFYDIPKMASLELMQEKAYQYLEEMIQYYPGEGEYKAELVNEVYVPAVGGTPQDPDGGTDGSYSFQVKITDYANRTFTTRTLDEDIEHSKFIGFDQVKVEGNQLNLNVVQHVPNIRKIYFAYYQDNLFLGCNQKFVCLDGDKITENFTDEIPEEANKVKVFLWDSATHKKNEFSKYDEQAWLQPVCPSAELTKNEQGEWE